MMDGRRRGKVIVWVVVAVLLAVGLAIGLAPRLGLLDDAPGLPPVKQEEPTIQVEADPAPSFEPNALKELVQRHQAEGINATVTAYMRWLAANAKRIREIKDYSMRLLKTERVAGKVWPTEIADVKVRHQPFSVYMAYSEPKGLKGQEAIFVDGKNEGRIVGHTGGILSLVGTLRILPTSPRAMQGNRHPITEIGLAHMVEEAVRNVPVDQEKGYTDFEFKLDEMVEGKSCTCFIVKRKRSEPTDHDPAFHSDWMYFDDALLLPIYYRRFEWPSKAGEEPVLVEEYTHQNLKLNNGFSDLDFDEKNPAYRY
jgi:hypothetical protein